MKRYAVIAKGLDLARVQDEVKKCGGRNIKLAPISGQVFCDLDDAGASKLQSAPGLVVKLLKKVKSQDTLGGIIPPEPGPGPLEVPIYASSQVSLASELFYLRSALDPPITGKNITIAILDSGIRHTHEGLRNKVIYEANLSNSPTCEDIYDHGCISGDAHIITSHCGIQRTQKLYEELEQAYGSNDGTIAVPDSEPIYTIGFKDGKSIRTRVHQVHKIRVLGEVYRIKTCTGEVLTTPWHPFLTWHRGNRSDGYSKHYRYHQADKLHSGTGLARSNYPIGVTDKYRELSFSYNLPSYGIREEIIPIDEKVGYILGLIAADGHLSDYRVNNQLRIFCANKDEAEVIAMASSVLGKPKICQDRTSWVIYLGNRAWAIAVAAGIPRGKKAHTVDVPEIIGKSPASVQLAFLAGEIDGDGSFSRRTLRIVTASESFANNLSYLIDSLGGKAYVSYQDDSRDRLYRNKGIHRMFTVSLNGTSLRNFSKWLEPYLRLKKLPRPNYGRQANYYGTRRVSLVRKERYDGYFYDLSTETGNYLAGMGDLFVIHNTGVAYCAAGGRHSLGEESGIAPGATLWNIKVLDDDGEGSEENVVMAIEHCIDRKLKLMESGLPENDPQIANFMNLSWGAPDDGDPDNPIRLACKAAFEARIGSVVAAGNGGSAPGSIMSPACDPNVVAVGAVTFVPFEVWEFSGRGPSKEGLIKPDVVFYGVRVLTASSKSDSAFVIKSGTSFSTPYVTGLGALGAELLVRKYGEIGIITTEVECIEEVQKAWKEVVPPGRLTVKPEGYSVAVKDCDYGHGMPLGSLIAQAISPVVDISTITEMVVPIMGLGMVGMMMAGMAKGMKV